MAALPFLHWKLFPLGMPLSQTKTAKLEYWNTSFCPWLCTCLIIQKEFSKFFFPEIRTYKQIRIEIPGFKLQVREWFFYLNKELHLFEWQTLTIQVPNWIYFYFYLLLRDNNCFQILTKYLSTTHSTYLLLPADLDRHWVLPLSISLTWQHCNICRHSLIVL